MIAYIVRRLIFMIPTLLGIMVINFAIVQFAPGGPVERTIAQLKGNSIDSTLQITGGGGDSPATTSQQNLPGIDAESRYRGARGLDPDFIREIERMYGFDQPAYKRFWKMILNYLQFDFGESWFKGRPVLDLIVEKFPISISLGLWTTLITYLVSIPLGIAKATRDGSPFDVWTSAAIIVGTAIPGFLFAIFLIILFGGGSYLDWFPIRGITSDGWVEFSWWKKIADYFWHLALPLTAMLVGAFASLTLLTKNSFLEQIHQQYVLSARAKGLSERRILYGHVFRNAMLIVIAGFPGAFISILFTGSLLIEIIFSLDGLGLLGYEAVLNRDYPIVFATLYIYTLIGLITQLLGDITYMLVDPRIDFEARST